ncbi:MAG: TonB-dependent receptor [Bacteroidota bacterium]
MRTTLLSILCLLVGTKYLSAQLTGRVLDGNGLPIPYANATIHNASDNTLHSGTLTDESGSFLLELSEEGAYILQISLLSFQSWNSEVFIVSSKPFEKDFPSIVLKEENTQLEGVAVTGQRKLIQRTQEGSVINVQESILTQGSSALQVLERAPGVILDRRNNSFSLNGRSGTLVMINGKAQRIPIADLMALLNGMSADNIQKIELLTNPSSKYDADGNAGIINIVLKKNEALGLRGSIGLSGGYGEGPKQTSNFSLNYGGNHSSLFGTYTFSYDDSSSGWRGVGVTDLPVLGGNTNIVFTSNSQQINRNHNVNFGYEHRFSEHLLLGANILYNHSRPLVFTRNRGLYDFVIDPFLDARIHLNGDGNRKNGTASMYFEKNGKNTENESTFSITMDYVNYNNKAPNFVNSTYFDQNGNPFQPDSEIYNQGNRGFNETDIKLGVLKIDYSKKLNETFSMEAGIKGSYSQTDNDARIEIQQGDDFVNDERFISRIGTTEKIAAVYSLADYQWSKNLKIQLGLRYENWTQDFSDAALNRNFGKLFPSFFLNHSLSDTTALRFAYTKRITRPNYSDLASFLSYNGPTSVFSGNPQLLPAITDNLTLTYSNKSLSVTLAAANEDNPFARFQITKNPQSTVAVIAPVNLEYQRSLEIQTNIPVRISHWWNMNLNATAGIREFKLLHTAEKVTHNYPHFNVNGSQTWLLPKDFSFELSGWYTSRHFNGSARVDGFGILNFGLKKSFGNNANLQLSITDIFENFDIRSQVGTLTREAFGDEFEVNYSSESGRSRIYNVSFTYSFGNRKVRETQARTGAASEKSRL